jgi:hypothetical protein
MVSRDLPQYFQAMQAETCKKSRQIFFHVLLQFNVPKLFEMKRYVTYRVGKE